MQKIMESYCYKCMYIKTISRFTTCAEHPACESLAPVTTLPRFPDISLLREIIYCAGIGPSNIHRTNESGDPILQTPHAVVLANLRSFLYLDYATINGDNVFYYSMKYTHTGPTKYKRTGISKSISLTELNTSVNQLFQRLCSDATQIVNYHGGQILRLFTMLHGLWESFKSYPDSVRTGGLVKPEYYLPLIGLHSQIGYFISTTCSDNLQLSRIWSSYITTFTKLHWLANVASGVYYVNRKRDLLYQMGQPAEIDFLTGVGYAEPSKVYPYVARYNCFTIGA